MLHVIDDGTTQGSSVLDFVVDCTTNGKGETKRCAFHDNNAVYRLLKVLITVEKRHFDHILQSSSNVLVIDFTVQIFF